MKKLMNTAERISVLTGFISGIFMSIVMVVVVANIIARRFFNAPIFGATELAQYGMMIAASLALFNNEWHDGNITVTIIIGMLSEKARTALGMLMNLIGTVGIGYATYYIGAQAIYKFNSGEISSDLRMPVWVFVSVLTFGVAILTLCLLSKTILCCYSLVSGKPLSIVHSDIDAGP